MTRGILGLITFVLFTVCAAFDMFESKQDEVAFAVLAYLGLRDVCFWADKEDNQ